MHYNEFTFQRNNLIPNLPWAAGWNSFTKFLHGQVHYPVYSPVQWTGRTKKLSDSLELVSKCETRFTRHSSLRSGVTS